MTERDMLLDKVLNQIQEDVDNGDMTALQELIANLPDNVLTNFLSEI